MNMQIDPTRLARAERDAAEAAQFVAARLSVVQKIEYDHDDGLVHNHDWARSERARR